MHDSRPELPTPRTPTEPAATDRPRRSSGIGWWLVALMAALVLIVEMPNELISWRYAAALEAREKGDKEQAAKMLAELLQKQPEDPRFLDTQYEWNYEDGKYEAALEYLQQQFLGEQEGSKRFSALLMLRSDLYLHLRRFPEAIADCLELARFNKMTGIPDREQVLNHIAYARALGDADLDAALVDSEASIAISRANLADAEQTLQKAIGTKKSVFVAQANVAAEGGSLMGCLDTRGLVHFKRGEHVAAQSDFNEAVALLRQVREFYRLHEKTFSVRHRKYQTFAKQKKLFDHNDAVIYYHRSLNLRKLGRKNDAQRDWEKARDLLGKEPDESLF